MKYIKSGKYQTDEFMSKIMGPNPVKLTEELISDCKIPKGSVVAISAADRDLQVCLLRQSTDLRCMLLISGATPARTESFLSRRDCPRQR